ncbi:MAG: flagellar assembly protein FliW [Spirochaetales bacterium]|nr:flagellar assembly protein FliW [Spirochaetales bacterium]
MKVETKAYGFIDVDARQKINFPQGILGFENFHEFVLIDAKQQPFFWLQSIEVVDISFLLINPKIFRSDYEVEVDDDELTEIHIESEEDILVLAIVTIPENTSKMTANLQGPIIINKRTREARQSIHKNSKWKTRHVILEELAAMEQK